MKKKRLLLLSTRKFWPTNSGKDITLYYNCKGLAEQYGYDVYLYCFTDISDHLNEEKPNFIKGVKFSKKNKKLNVIVNLLYHSLLKKDWSLQSSALYSKNREKEIFDYYNEVCPDVIIYDMVRLLPYKKILKKHVGTKIMILDDLLSTRYLRQLKSSDSSGNIFGQLSNKLPNWISKIANHKKIRSIILQKEANLVEKEEKNTINYFDSVTFISSIEKDEFNNRYNTNKAKVLSMGVDYEYYSIKQPDIKVDEKLLCFVGNLNVPANYDSVVDIIENILPLLNEDIKFHIIGPCLNEMKKKYENKNVKFLGRVEDLRNEVKRASIFFAPIKYGTGIKTKIVEAMAMGIPVITNSIGAEGLFAKQDDDWIVRDDKFELAKEVNSLLSDNQKRKRIGLNGQLYVKQNHTWEKIYLAFEDILKEE